MNICWHSFSDSTRKGRCSGCRKGNECTAYHFGIVGYAGDLKAHEKAIVLARICSRVTAANQTSRRSREMWI